MRYPRVKDVQNIFLGGPRTNISLNYWQANKVFWQISWRLRDKNMMLLDPPNKNNGVLLNDDVHILDS